MSNMTTNTTAARISSLIEAKIESLQAVGCGSRPHEIEERVWQLTEAKQAIVARACATEVLEHTRVCEIADWIAAILDINIPAWEYPTMCRRQKLDELYQEVRVAFQA